MFRILLGFLILAFGAGLAANVTTIAAQSSVEFESSISNNYPTNLEFKLTASSDAVITDVSLHYSIVGAKSIALGKPDELSPGTSIFTTVEVLTNSANNYIPVGSEFIYFWELTLDDGSTVTGEEDSFFFLPPDKEWKTVSNDILTVYYHGDRERTAELYLEAGTDTYETIGKQVLQATLTQLPVKVILFSNEAEMDEAGFGRSSTYDAQTITCGTKVTSDIVMIIPVSCGSTDITDTLRHEFTHILTEAAGESPLGRLPAWLNEGTAVYSQSEPGSGYVGPFQSAARADRLMPFVSMASPSSDPNMVNLFYGQSWAMVDYLISQYGEDAFADFYATIKEGNRFETAMQEVYGFDLAGFEDEFHQFHGVRSFEQPTTAPTPAPRNDASQPTTVPTEIPEQVTNFTDSDDGISMSLIIVVGVAVLFALMAVFFYLVSMMMASGREGGGEV